MLHFESLEGKIAMRYFPFFLGTNRVVISLYTRETGLNVNNFQLRACPRNDQRFSMLCEKGKVLIDPKRVLTGVLCERVLSLLTLVDPC